jgi:hypothetical protein
MQNEERVEQILNSQRQVTVATPGDELLGPLSELPGVWKNVPGLEGRGWNMIALPFISEETGIDYRILMNQFNEELSFALVDKGVPNRGVERQTRTNLNQKIVTLDYEQVVEQIAAEDMPISGLAGSPGAAIHHEPGLFLNILNFQTNGNDIARLGTIPHGNSVLAMGKSFTVDGPPIIAPVDVLPIGVSPDINSPYLSPYKHFHDNPFRGIFDVLNPHGLLAAAVPPNVVRTTVLDLSTKTDTGGISNIPFIVDQANTTEMNSIFWILELDEMDDDGKPVFLLQYMQVVMLEFFPRRDGQPGLIRWPHVSFNTMRRMPVSAPRLLSA